MSYQKAHVYAYCRSRPMHLWKFPMFVVMLAFGFSGKDSQKGQVNQIHPSDIGGGPPPSEKEIKGFNVNAS